MSIKEIQQKRLENIFEKYSADVVKESKNRDRVRNSLDQGDYLLDKGINKFTDEDGTAYTRNEYEQEFKRFWNTYKSDIKKGGNEFLEYGNECYTSLRYSDVSEKVKAQDGSLVYSGIDIFPNYDGKLMLQLNPTKATQISEDYEEVFKFVVKSISDRLQFLIRKYKVVPATSRSAYVIREFKDAASKGEGFEFLADMEWCLWGTDKDYILLEGKYNKKKESALGFEINFLGFNFKHLLQWKTEDGATSLRPKLRLLTEEVHIVNTPIRTTREDIGMELR